MTFEEKYAAQGRKLDELKAKIDGAITEGKAAREKNRAQLAAEMEALDARIDDFNAAVDAKVDAKIDEIDVKINDQAEKISAQMDRAEEKAEAKEQLRQLHRRYFRRVALNDPRLLHQGNIKRQ